MLLSNDVACGIADGTISVVFRRWQRPNVTAGDTLRSAAGVVAIDSVTAIDPSGISDADAVASGAGSPAELLSSLRGSSDQPLYRIAVHWHGPDPRYALSAESMLSPGQVGQARERLATLDKRSNHGAWTHATLRRIADCPGRPARDLAEALGRNKEDLKLDIRKLKNLGLTRSLDVGYHIAPRGTAYLAALDAYGIPGRKAREGRLMSRPWRVDLRNRLSSPSRAGLTTGPL